MIFERDITDPIEEQFLRDEFSYKPPEQKPEPVVHVEREIIDPIEEQLLKEAFTYTPPSKPEVEIFIPEHYYQEDLRMIPDPLEDIFREQNGLPPKRPPGIVKHVTTYDSRGISTTTRTEIDWPEVRELLKKGASVIRKEDLRIS